jgi:adenylosuccinate synthase
MPTELHGQLGDKLRGTGTQPWDEFGTTTGRPRRCGWLDIVSLEYAARINGLTEIAITKLDILSSFDQIKICVAYDLDGQRIEALPNDLTVLARCLPIYEMLPGWETNITATKSYRELPGNAQRYVARIEEILGIPASFVSVGPGREQTIIR